MSNPETQDSITQWAGATFGDCGTNLRAAIRANEEMSELLRALSVDDNAPDAGAEIADVFIVLYRVASRLGVDVHRAIDAKMRINRLRRWSVDGSGHGYHVKDEVRKIE